jgi:hypothetical protein
MPEQQKVEKPQVPETGEVDVVDKIRNLRNELVKDFLDDRFLLEYLQTRYNQIDISRVKIEFIRKDLKQLLISPVDLQHYKAIIEDFRANESFSLSEGNESYFYKEVESVLKKHLYT